MPPKKKEEEPPPAEDLLPTGFSVGCEVHWVTNTITLESGVEVKPGTKGTLEAIGDLRNEVGTDEVKRWFIDIVTVKLEDCEEPQQVPLSSLSLDPPPLDMLDALCTGLKLPLRGVDVDKIWSLGENNFDKQSDLIMRMLGLKERYGVGQTEIVCDYHLYNLVHAKCLCLDSVQGAVFLAIMDEMLRMMFSTAATPDMRPGDMCTSETCFRAFQHLMVTHAREDPPKTLGIFRDSEVRLLTDFASVTLFKHYLLYQYCINFDREIETLRFNPHLERPSSPPDLNVGNPDLKRRQAPESTHLHADRDNLEAPVGTDEQREEAPAPEEQREPTEEEKVAQLVAEKLKDVSDKLEERLRQREADFLQQYEEQKAAAKGAAKKKPK